MKIEEVMRKIGEESKRAERKHGPADWFRHHFYGIMLEEVDELWEAIKENKPSADIEAEIVQIASLCVRYLERKF